MCTEVECIALFTLVWERYMYTSIRFMYIGLQWRGCNRRKHHYVHLRQGRQLERGAVSPREGHSRGGQVKVIPSLGAQSRHPLHGSTLQPSLTPYIERQSPNDRPPCFPWLKLKHSLCVITCPPTFLFTCSRLPSNVNPPIKFTRVNLNVKFENSNLAQVSTFANCEKRCIYLMVHTRTVHKKKNWVSQKYSVLNENLRVWLLNFPAKSAACWTVRLTTAVLTSLWICCLVAETLGPLLSSHPLLSNSRCEVKKLQATCLEEGTRLASEKAMLGTSNRPSTAPAVSSQYKITDHGNTTMKVCILQTHLIRTPWNPSFLCCTK